MRLALLGIGLAACGGAPATTTTPASTPAASPAPAALGTTSGYTPSILAATLDDVIAAAELDAAAVRVSIELVTTFDSVDACFAEWRRVRAALDGRFGPSGEDNGASYWQTATLDVAAMCNPFEDGDGGQVLVTLSPLEP